MHIIRRVYIYLLTGVGLALVATGAANLLRIVLQVLTAPQTFGWTEPIREEVAQWGAAAIVGLPVWAFHWWLAQRSARDPEERGSALRRLYLYIALAVAAISAALALEDFLHSLAAPRPGQDLGDVLDALPTLLVASVAWLFNWRVAEADRAAVGEVRASGTLRRWYLYGLAFISLWVMLEGARQLLEDVWTFLAEAGFGGSRDVAAAAPQALVGLGLWLLHWRVLPARLTPQAQADDQRSTLRSVYLFLGLAVTVGGTILGASQILYYALARALGVSEPGGQGGSLLLVAAGPTSQLLVYGVGWLYQRASVKQQESAEAEAPRQVGTRRLYGYLVALFGVSALAIGVGGLLWTIADLLTNRASPVNPNWWRDEIARNAMLVIVALPVWITHWRDGSAISDEEAHSLARRIYTYLALIGGGLALVGSGVMLVYLPLSLLLGAAATSSLVSDLLRALMTAIVAGVVVGYHVRVVRADAARPKSEASEPAEAGSAERVVRLTAASAEELDAALQLLRERGVSVEDESR